MSVRKRFQEMLDHPSLIHALQIYRHHYAGDGLLTRKPVNESAAGASEITTERASEKAGHLDMAGVHPLEPHPPLYTVPNRYKDRRPCTCKEHEGNRWRPIADFSVRKGKNGKTYPQSWCKQCTARYVYQVRHRETSEFA